MEKEFEPKSFPSRIVHLHYVLVVQFTKINYYKYVKKLYINQSVSRDFIEGK